MGEGRGERDILGLNRRHCRRRRQRRAWRIREAAAGAGRETWRQLRIGLVVGVIINGKVGNVDVGGQGVSDSAEPDSRMRRSVDRCFVTAVQRSRTLAG
jgi:hypothetical protein